MATASSGYGNYQPSAVDPFPIESVLAKIVGDNNPVEAANMLDLYQIQNATQRGNYEYAARQQHAFAKEQLAQQLKEHYITAAQQGVQHPGGLDVLYGQGGEDALPGYGSGAYDSIRTGLANARDAKTLGDVTGAAKSGVEAGTPVDLPTLTRLSGGGITSLTTPLSTANIALREAGADRRAASRVSGISAEGFDTTDAYGLKVHHSIPKNATPEEIDAYKRNVLGLKPIEPTKRPQRLPTDVQPSAAPSNPDASVLTDPSIPDSNGGGTDGSPPARESGAKLPPPPPFVTRLQPKPASTPTQQPAKAPVSGRASPQNEAARVRSLQDVFIANANNPEWMRQPGHAQVVAGMKTNGGRPQVIIENGQPHFVGADGQRY